MALEIERHQMPTVDVPLGPDGLAERERCAQVIQRSALTCAAISAEPIPWVDTALVLPLQIKLVIDIGRVYGFALTRERARAVALELGGAFLYGYASRQVVRGLGKFAMPVLGGLLTAPVVYASTHTLGHLAERHFRALRQDLPALGKEAERAWIETLLAEGKRLGRQIGPNELRRAVALIAQAALRRKR